MKRFECKNLGQQCEFTAESESVDELVQKAEAHAAAAHNLPRGPETQSKIRAAIKDKP